MTFTAKHKDTPHPEDRTGALCARDSGRVLLTETFLRHSWQVLFVF